jgi:hypothetical protein
VCMIFIVCGGSEFREEAALAAALDQLHAADACRLVITGGAEGAERYGDRWGSLRGIDRIIVPANWEGHRTAAVPRRNAHMVQLARLLAEAMKQDLRVIAFPGNSGTDDMCRKARATGIQVIEPMGEGAHVR